MENIFLFVILFIKKKERTRKRTREREKGYPTGSIKGSPNGAVSEIDTLSDIINVGVSTIGEHGFAAGEKEAVAVVSDPILRWFWR